MPVSPCFSPIFHAYNLTRSPPSECRLYVLKVWNRLHYSRQVLCFCCPFYRAFITLDIIILRMSSFSALLLLLYCMFFQPENSQPSSLIGTCLTLPNLGFLWVFFKYPKISKSGNLLFFPVNKTKRWTILQLS